MDIKLAQKIFNVMEESEGIEKNMTVGTGNNSYKAVSEASVLNAIKPLLKKHKLIIIPIDVEVQERVDSYQTSNTYNGVTTANDKARLMTQLKTKWKIIDVETGEFEILAAPGNGADTQDKASGKAWTYAYKAVIQKTFMLFSGEDTDNTHSDDIGLGSTTTSKKLSEGQVKRLFAIAKSSGVEAGKVKADVIKSTGKTKIEDMTKEEYDRACNHYEGLKQ